VTTAKRRHAKLAIETFDHHCTSLAKFGRPLR
jgi:hypothetical protein